MRTVGGFQFCTFLLVKSQIYIILVSRVNFNLKLLDFINCGKSLAYLMTRFTTSYTVKENIERKKPSK